MTGNRIHKPSEQNMKFAANLLRQGNIVSFPTETVYGLGADATNSAAIAKIYQAKNRPSFNPLIIHLSEAKTVSNYVKMNELAKRLAENFWPGPFTMVLPLNNNNGLSDLVTAGLKTAAIRVPENPVAQSLLMLFDGPIAAPSANKSGHISPTSAKHVDSEFGEELEIIIDDGPCKKGLESTIVEVTDNQVRLLRPGSITPQQIEEVIGQKIIPTNNAFKTPNAPGQLKSHYAPQAQVRLNAVQTNRNECLLAFGDVNHSNDVYSLNLSTSGNLEEAATNLFSMMRKLDKKKYSTIAVSPIPEIGLGIAINDRLKRAAAPKDEDEP